MNTKAKVAIADFESLKEQLLLDIPPAKLIGISYVSLSWRIIFVLDYGEQRIKKGRAVWKRQQETNYGYMWLLTLWETAVLCESPYCVMI